MRGGGGDVSAHTSLPWRATNQWIERVDRDNVFDSVPLAPSHHGWVTDAGGYKHDEACANAAFIVKCVNSHAALVEALKALVYETTHLSPQEEDGSHVCKISKRVLDAGRAALALAEQPR